MKCYIDDELSCTFPVSTTSAVDADDVYPALLNTLASFSVFYKCGCIEEHATLTIIPQKITLTDQDMNTLFFEVLHPYFPHQMTYTTLGGERGEFSIRLAPC